ncbi:hypothetical protein ACWGLP_02545 [Streptomyces lydicus]
MTSGNGVAPRTEQRPTRFGRRAALREPAAVHGDENVRLVVRFG